MNQLASKTIDLGLVDDELKIVRWADDLGASKTQLLGIDLAERPIRLAQSDATGEGLVTNGFLGVDVIRLAAGEGFAPHTHPGDHLLIVVGGEGTVTYGGRIYPTRAGETFLVEGEVPHAVGAITDHVILAVGAPHRTIGSVNRLTPVRYESVTSRADSLHCLLCDITASSPWRLHDGGCPHCPCGHCHDA